MQDSTSFAIAIEQRYKGMRAPHKLKGGVSGCVRECAEAQSKDFGLIATEKGWNVYVCGNGGASPRHAELLVSDVDEATAIHYLDRFLMFYIRTADRLTRTSVWLDKMEGGIGQLRRIVVDDSLGIAADLEREMQALVDTYSCEWADVVRDPVKRASFRHFANDARGDRTVSFTPKRGQPKPAVAEPRDGPSRPQAPSADDAAGMGARRRRGRRASRGRDRRSSRRRPDGGLPPGLPRRVVRHAEPVPHTSARWSWRAASSATRPERPKVACPLHKKTFDLKSGTCLSGDPLEIATFPVRVEGGEVWVELPPAEEMAVAACDPATEQAPEALAS